MNDSRFFNVFVGTKFMGGVYARNADEAIRTYAAKTRSSPWIYHAEPGATIQDLKVPKVRSEQS